MNVAMFGKTAKQWRDANPSLDGNIRDHATLHQLIVLSNMESLNAEMIKRGLVREDRLLELNRVAKEQMQSLINSAGVRRLTDLNEKDREEYLDEGLNVRQLCKKHMNILKSKD